MAKQLTLASKASNTDKPTVKKDDNGYYLVNLGAFNTYNSAGQFYKCDNPTLDYLRSTESILGRRINKGMLRSEYQHPTYDNCKKISDTRSKVTCITQRAIKIDLDRVCAHIKSINFNVLDRAEKGWEKYPIILVNGWAKPTGPYKDELKEALENPDENVAFSIRSLVKQDVVGVEIVKTIKDVSTWDYVFEPGIKVATQWNAVGLENRSCDVCVNGVCSNVLKDILVSSEELDKHTVERLTMNILEDENDPLAKW